MAQDKIVLQHTADVLLIGMGLQRRFLLLGFGLMLTLLAATGVLRLLSHGGIAAAILLPVLAVMVLIGIWAMYACLASTNDVYDKSEQCFLRYSGNLLTGKRVATRLPLDALEAIDSNADTEAVARLVCLRTAAGNIDISDYTPATVQTLARFLAF